MATARFTSSKVTMTKNIYLTIDDAPSKYMEKKVELLLKHHIPALFFCRGECIALHKEYVVEAIQKGFLIGNHSYTHPYFSQIPLEQCFEEILKTEALIDNCYHQANIERPCKVIRLPFGDRGAGKHAREAVLDEEKEKVFQIQSFMKEVGFVPLDKNHKHIDAYWDWDAQDYKSKWIQHPDEYVQQLESFWQNSKQETHTLLVHDFDHTHHLFERTLQFLMSKNCQFLNTVISS